VPLDKIFQEAFKCPQSIARIGLHFGGTLINVQAERLCVNTLSGADTLDLVVEAISNLDSSLSKQIK
jgi:hypothetical protein